MKLKFTRYFEHTRHRPDRMNIKMEWIEQVVDDPEYEQIQSEGRIRCWAKIAEAGNRYLRVVLLGDRETVHNVFFDRTRKAS